jgi:hypothetical protein
MLWCGESSAAVLHCGAACTALHQGAASSRARVLRCTSSFCEVLYCVAGRSLDTDAVEAFIWHSCNCRFVARHLLLLQTWSAHLPVLQSPRCLNPLECCNAISLARCCCCCCRRGRLTQGAAHPRVCFVPFFTPQIAAMPCHWHAAAAAAAADAVS